MKRMGLHVELVREHCKYWAWNDRKVGEWDQIYLLGKQSAYESMLYNKVDYVVTDSPILLAGMYQDLHSDGNRRYVKRAAYDFMSHANSRGVTYVNFFLQRSKPFDPRGRWESEERAREVDIFIKGELESEGQPFSVIRGPERWRDLEILSYMDMCMPWYMYVAPLLRTIGLS